MSETGEVHEAFHSNKNFIVFLRLHAWGLFSVGFFWNLFHEEGN